MNIGLGRWDEETALPLSSLFPMHESCLLQLKWTVTAGGAVMGC